MGLRWRADVRVDNDDTQSDPAATTTAFRRFFTEDPSSLVERPKKRPRLDPGPEREEAQHTPSFVTLASGCIHLIVPHAVQREHSGISTPKAKVLLKRSRRTRHNPISANRSGDGPLDITLTHGTKLCEMKILLSSVDEGCTELYGLVKDLCSLSHRSSPKFTLRATDVAFANIFLVSPDDDATFYTLEYEIKWMCGISALSFLKSPWLYEIARKYLPGSFPTPQRSWSAQDFYSSVHCPDPNIKVSEAIQARGLVTKLYPFQRRSVAWLLRREHVRLDAEGHVVPAKHVKEGLPMGYSLQQDSSSNNIYVSHLEAMVRTDLDEGCPLATLRGGILGEEMGLGKTLEIIALILLNKPSTQLSGKVIDPYTGNIVRSSGATLIITPTHILEQWKSELARHSPSLVVYHYEGLQKSRLSDNELEEHLLQQDVILTTYSVLAKEVHYAEKAPDRSLRHEKTHKPRRTPLVQISFWRVCCDESNMIESGVSNSARVARLIPRRHAWGVSGLPLRMGTDDLLGLLIFLRVEPFCHPPIFRRLVNGAFPDMLGKLINQITLRHAKKQLRTELAIPPQRRLCLTVPFTATEEQHYIDLYQEMCHDLCVDSYGAPLVDDWNPDNPMLVEKMRQWLTRMRQTCLHAEIGSSNRRAFGSKSGPLRTVDEVLEKMLDQNETALRSQERSMLGNKVMRGHLLSFAAQTKEALDTYLEALAGAQSAVDECREHLKEVKRKASGLARSDRDETTHGESEEEGEEVARQGPVGICKQRLRSALEVLHICLFFAGTAYFQLKDNKDVIQPDSDMFKDLEGKESECYGKAKAIREELLSSVTRKTNRLMEKVAISKSETTFSLTPIEINNHYRGLESRETSRTIKRMISDLNEYSGHLNGWRARLVDLLTRRLVDQEDEEVTGQEYERSTKEQDEQYVLLEVIRAAIADRYCLITGQTNVLINREMQQALKRTTDGVSGDPDDKGPAPELFMSLLATRISINPKPNIYVPPGVALPTEQPISFRGVMTDLRSIMMTAQWSTTDRSRVEAHIIELELASLQEVQTQLMKENERLDAELTLFRGTMNQRLEFYRQLQQISDAVAPLQDEISETLDQERLDAEQRREDVAARRLAKFKTKRRFLLHLRDQTGDKAEQRICTICQEDFQTGVLTVCGHQYCKECLLLWYKTKKSCPVCKQKLNTTDFHNVTYKPRELLLAETEDESQIASEAVSSSPSTPSKASIYSNVGQTTLNDIMNVDLPGKSYGVKIDTLSRQIMWLRRNDPGAKAIIFSQFGDFLSVLGSAFATHKIGYTEFGSKQAVQRFKEDAGIEAFLLHAKANSSGLNLVNATHVFLCEPLINTAIELQAIARVHRIGQQRMTTVWMYVVRGTVEEAIYDISVTRRLAHIITAPDPSNHDSRAVTPDVLKVEEDTLDNANSLELQSAIASRLLTGKSGGEMVAKDDLWKCLFSRPRKEDVLLTTAGKDTNDAASQEMRSFLAAEAAESRAS